MTTMLKRVSPVLKVSDTRRALAFYQDRLGFHCTFKLDDDLHPEIPYAVVVRDQVQIHLQLAPSSAGLSSCHITVDGVDALYRAFHEAGVTFIRAIENASYGARDFTIADVDGNNLSFAQPLDPG
jgi:uncharacterized glyoxalase superfamily protein PhnB